MKRTKEVIGSPIDEVQVHNQCSEALTLDSSCTDFALKLKQFNQRFIRKGTSVVKVGYSTAGVGEEIQLPHAGSQGDGGLSNRSNRT